MKDTIGILLDPQSYMKLPRRRIDYEHLDLYNQAAEQLEVKLFYTTLPKIGRSSARGYMYQSGKLHYCKAPIPRVMHNRAITLVPYGKRKLTQLAKSSVVFNQITRIGKYRIHKLLTRKETLREHLPATMKYSRDNLKKAMLRFDSFYVKPTNGSVGDGILKLARQPGGRWLIYWRRGKPLQKRSKHAAAMVQRMVGRRSYLIQETIALATYQGKPYDLRVSVQRGETGDWQVTGIVGKVAAAGRHVTNVAKGGKVKRCEELFEASGFSAETIKEEITRVSIEIADHLSQHFPHLADLGLDLGVDREGNVKFIEMNGRDQRITFKKAGLSTTFYDTYYTPLLYGKHLLNGNRSEV